jgi:hypothetical protein
VRELLVLGECDILDCARVMNRKRNLPNKRIALERLARVHSIDVIHRVDPAH